MVNGPFIGKSLDFIHLLSTKSNKWILSCLSEVKKNDLITTLPSSSPFCTTDPVNQLEVDITNHSFFFLFLHHLFKDFVKKFHLRIDTGSCFN